MQASDLRQKYFDFFKSIGHKLIPSASLIPENDPTTLFTSSGMQQLVPYFKGEPHPLGKRLVDSQPSIRLQDIEEVGDNRHTTFFEMLGNWSLGDYFKKEQLTWCWEFLTKELGLPEEKLYVSVFEGSKEVPKDEESIAIWKSLGVPEQRIFYYSAKKNWWSRSGTPEEMPVGEIGGPDSEIFFDFGLEHDPKFGKECHPNCDCGRFIEIGNSVFIQYQKQADGSLTELPQKNVDFGGGLERMVAAVNNNPDIFQIDLFAGARKILEEVDLVNSDESKKAIKIILDHLRASIFLIDAGIVPSNKQQGYVLRRLIRRIALYSKTANFDIKVNLILVLREFCDAYSSAYPTIKEKQGNIYTVISEELEKFFKTLDQGIKEVEKADPKDINAQFVFNSLATYGMPFEITQELIKKKGVFIDKEEFEKEMLKHKELSRTASAGMFKGGLGEQSEITTKYHTATHLLNAALKEILGDHVCQKGSNITSERLRFDFPNPEKLSEEQIKEVEDLVNKKIKENLPVTMDSMSLEEARKSNANAVFSDRYQNLVKVYSIGNFSKEVCGGPHADFTGTLGKFKMIKEESAGAGIRRLYAILE